MRFDVNESKFTQYTLEVYSIHQKKNKKKTLEAVQ